MKTVLWIVGAIVGIPLVFLLVSAIGLLIQTSRGNWEQ